ncbi:MAG: putative t-diRNAhydrouridine synthase [Streblomastix strix]|uniref:Putative t-diRNAhydrouridine synthase n=1 Tax=Streblomastix strix TaxID=222440 RepID=A0A5J4X9M7_9EUKA|nr:MAG: putative t-diRNAhydrouridine synthase [Streblomastix strix]
MSSTEKKGKEDCWDFWKRIGSPKYVSAPMIGASTLACRKLFRKYSVDLCYSPMIIASLFLEDSDYREKILTTDSDDRPIFVQFCGDNAQIMAQAAKQAFAEKCHYGAYLQDEWDLMREIVSTMNRELNVCVSAKFRMQATIDKTVGMAQMLQEAGAQVITMHEQITVPFIVNGGIISLEQADHILDLTKANAVMVGEGLRRNPALFAGIERNPYKLCNELIDISKKEPQNVYYPQSTILGPTLGLAFEYAYGPEINLLEDCGLFKYEKEQRQKKLQLMRSMKSLQEEGEELKNEKEEQEQQKESIDMNKGLQDKYEMIEELNNQEMKKVSKAEQERWKIANTTHIRKCGAKDLIIIYRYCSLPLY